MSLQPNLNYIHELSGGDKEFEDKMLSILKSEFPTEVAYYKKTIENKDFKESAQIVHKIKHKISILGMEESYVLAEQYERELNSGQVSTHNEFLEVLNSMSNFLDKL